MIEEVKEDGAVLERKKNWNERCVTRPRKKKVNPLIRTLLAEEVEEVEEAEEAEEEGAAVAAMEIKDPAETAKAKDEETAREVTKTQDRNLREEKIKEVEENDPRPEMSKITFNLISMYTPFLLCLAGPLSKNSLFCEH